MRLSSILVMGFLFSTPALAQSDLVKDAIQHDPKDGVVRRYGAGGPHTALQKVADAWREKTGKVVEITAGPERTWSEKAQADADIIWGTAQQSMTAFLPTYKAFSSDAVESIYIRPAVIAVKKGNPRGITGFDDLLKEGIKIVVTEGGGVSNTSGTGVWEDIAGRLGRLDDISAFRSNIVAFKPGSGASFEAFQSLDADAWITWPNWPATKPDVLQAVPLSADRAIWRDLSIVVAPDADPEAKSFSEFLVSEDARKLMATEGWER